MKSKYIVPILSSLLLFVASVKAQTVAKTENPPPHLEKRHGAIQLIVGSKPFIMVTGELHNSTSSGAEYFDEALKNVKQMNANTAIASISWEQLEPQENHFDFHLLDHIIKAAHEQNIKLVLLWFGSWKNGESSYMPLWVKRDTRRFFRIKDKSGNNMTAVSPFCQQAMQADAKAFTTMMQHIKTKNQFNDVMMIQAENEVGAFADIDHNKEALALYNTPVPEKLISYMVQNRNNLEKYLKTAWENNGAKTHGTWSELFGEKSLTAQHLFMSWQYASYLGEVCKQGKVAYDLPMYVNAWQEQTPEELPGKYPNGGPVSNVMDIYKSAAPAIDFISPDIYLPDFKEICSRYFVSAKNNPLFIPECERTNPGKAYYAMAEDDAIGFGPFGIESLVSDVEYAKSYAVLNSLLPAIAKYQGTGNMHGILKESNEDSSTVTMGKYKISIQYESKELPSYGIIIQTGEDEFLLAGVHLKVTFSTADKSIKAAIGEILEGEYVNGTWNTLRQLNGDETFHNEFVFAGRKFPINAGSGGKLVKPFIAPTPVLNQVIENNLKVKEIEAPGIYKIKLYQLSW